MNVAMIHSMILPYVRDRKLTYDDFEEIFGDLDLTEKEKRDISELLYSKGIELVDEYLVLDVDDQAGDAEDFEDPDPGEGKAPPVVPDEDLIVRKKVHQSNEILCSLIQQGSRQAAQDLYIKNINLINKYVAAYEKRYGHHLDSDDLVQAGSIGLLRAAKTFRIEDGNAFSTYAVYWIKQSIAREIMDNGYAIRIPVHMMERINKVSTISGRLTGEGVPLMDQLPVIARELGYTEDEIMECLVLKQNYLSYSSLDMPVGEDQETPLGDLIPVEEEETAESILEEKMLRQELSQILTTLTPREQDVLRQRIGWDDNDPKTLEEIGSLYGVTRERIRQIESKALKRLRHPSRSKRLKDYWEV